MKNSYVISYDPTKGIPSNFHNAIQNSNYISTWWHYLPSTYIVVSTHAASTIQDELCAKVPGQQFLIIKADSSAFGGWLPKDAWEWIRQHT